MTNGFAIGETHFDCWGRLWKGSRSDPEVDGEEWVTFVARIQEHFRSNYENFPDEFYFWDDFSGDRTLDLKIAKPKVLTAGLLSDLQKYLQTNGQKMWPFAQEQRQRAAVVIVILRNPKGGDGNLIQSQLSARAQNYLRPLGKSEPRRISRTTAAMLNQERENGKTIKHAYSRSRKATCSHHLQRCGRYV